MYAINSFRDPESGRWLVWAWLQENGRLKEDEYSYSGCLSMPRELFIRCACRQGQSQRVAQLHPRPRPGLARLCEARVQEGSCTLPHSGLSMRMSCTSHEGAIGLFQRGHQPERLLVGRQLAESGRMACRNGRLVQRPLPEMKLLRTDALWQHVSSHPAAQPPAAVVLLLSRSLPACPCLIRALSGVAGPWPARPCAGLEACLPVEISSGSMSRVLPQMRACCLCRMRQWTWAAHT